MSTRIGTTAEMPTDSLKHPPEPMGAMTVIELARAANVTPHVVRHYARIRLLIPRRDQDNGYKLFSRTDLKRLLFIRRAKLLGYTLADIRTILDEAEHGQSPCPKVRSIIRKRITENRQLIDEMADLQVRMEKALRTWEGLPDGVPVGDSICYLIDSIMETEEKANDD